MTRGGSSGLSCCLQARPTRGQCSNIHPTASLTGKDRALHTGIPYIQYTCGIYRKSVYSFKVLLMAVKCNQSALNLIEQKLIWPSAARQSRTPLHPKKTISPPYLGQSIRQLNWKLRATTQTQGVPYLSAILIGLTEYNTIGLCVTFVDLFAIKYLILYLTLGCVISFVWLTNVCVTS